MEKLRPDRNKNPGSNAQKRRGPGRGTKSDYHNEIKSDSRGRDTNGNRGGEQNGDRNGNSIPNQNIDVNSNPKDVQNAANDDLVNDGNDFGSERRQDDLATVTDTRERAERVKRAFQHAWRGYAKTAFGHDEIRPASNKVGDSWCVHSVCVFFFWRLACSVNMISLWQLLKHESAPDKSKKCTRHTSIASRRTEGIIALSVVQMLLHTVFVMCIFL